MHPDTVYSYLSSVHLSLSSSLLLICLLSTVFCPFVFYLLVSFFEISMVTATIHIFMVMCLILLLFFFYSTDKYVYVPVRCVICICIHLPVCSISLALCLYNISDLGFRADPSRCIYVLVSINALALLFCCLPFLFPQHQLTIRFHSGMK